MPYKSIQVNEGIAKFFTLMVGHLNKIMEFMQLLLNSKVIAKDEVIAKLQS
jgi:hypothetical protein